MRERGLVFILLFYYSHYKKMSQYLIVASFLRHAFVQSEDLSKLVLIIIFQLHKWPF